MCLIDRPQLASESWSNLRSQKLYTVLMSLEKLKWYSKYPDITLLITNVNCHIMINNQFITDWNFDFSLKLNTSWSRCQVSNKKPDQNSYSPSSSFLYNNADNTNNNKYEHHWKVLIHATINRTDTSLISIYYHQTRSIP